MFHNMFLVEYYGSPIGLKTIAKMSIPDASSLSVQPYDKSSLKAIEKTIVNSDVGMTPNNDGEVIGLSIPQLTSEICIMLSKFLSLVYAVAVKVLDAPSLQDDFYLNLADWSSQNT
ncbi:protein FIZZY-RELATED [Trifolium repens]|nr:protein FIZZY-RELATED [Trifolium repens]